MVRGVCISSLLPGQTHDKEPNKRNGDFAGFPRKTLKQVEHSSLEEEIIDIVQ